MVQPKHHNETVNEGFDPTDRQQTVLDVFADEYQISPMLIRDVTGIERQRVNDALESLDDAGWIEKRTRGLYRLVYDGDGYVGLEIVRREER